MKKLLFAATLVLLCAGTRVSAQESPDWTGDLSPISAAEWDRDKARHLLARAGFGGTPAEIDALAKLSPKAHRRRSCRRLTTPAFSTKASTPFRPAGRQPPRWPRKTARRWGSR